MANTKKYEQMAVFRLEKGKLATWSYGGSTVATFTGAIAIPYVSADKKAVKNVFEDDSVESHAFKSGSVKSMTGADLGGLDFNMRYIGMDRFLYAAMGYEDGLTSPQDLTGGIYSHLFELDKHDRHFAPYRTAEQTAADYNALDRKNRFGSLGFREGPNDVRYTHLGCNGFEFASAAGGPLTFKFKGVAKDEETGDYSVSSCTYASGVEGPANLVMHHHLTAQLGESGSLVTIGVKDVSISVDIPLTRDQDSVSGLFGKENELEGKMTITGSLTLSRHSTNDWRTLKKDHTKLAISLVWASGDYAFGIYGVDVKILNNDPTGDAVANETMELEFNASTTNPFAIGSHELKQNGPIFIYSKNNNSINEMRRE